jgi:drug/metabolite transporter (DMT)-like permease
MRYALGVASAIVAGIAVNAGILVQKAAIARLSADRPLMRSLLRSPAWIAGLAVQLVIGSPLYVISLGLIGPAVVPGLMSIGLVVLAVGSVRLYRERLDIREAVGVGLVILAVASFGLTHLAIDVLAVPITDGGLLLRSGAYTAALAVAGAGCGVAAGRARKRARGDMEAVLHAVRAGVFYSMGNLWLGFCAAGLAGFAGGVVDRSTVVVFLLAVLLTAVGNLVGVVALQQALARGRASIAVPLQNGVSQVLPVLVFFLVYRPYVPGAGSLGLLGAAGILLVAGVTLLTRRLASAQQRAAAHGPESRLSSSGTGRCPSPPRDRGKSSAR